MSNLPKHGITNLQLDNLPSENSFSNLPPSLNSPPIRNAISPHYQPIQQPPPPQPQMYQFPRTNGLMMQQGYYW